MKISLSKFLMMVVALALVTWGATSIVLTIAFHILDQLAAVR